MPLYEFKCKECGNVFSELKRMDDKSNAKCTSCESLETKKMFSTFASVSSNKSSSCAPSGGG